MINNDTIKGSLVKYWGRYIKRKMTFLQKEKDIHKYSPTWVTMDKISYLILNRGGSKTTSLTGSNRLILGEVWREHRKTIQVN